MTILFSLNLLLHPNPFHVHMSTIEQTLLQEKGFLVFITWIITNDKNDEVYLNQNDALFVAFVSWIQHRRQCLQIAFL